MKRPIGKMPKNSAFSALSAVKKYGIFTQYQLFLRLVVCF